MVDPIISEVSHPTKCCPNPTQWSCYDSEGTEIEVLDFLEQLVVMLKPIIAMETGCYRGYGTERLARGIQRNGVGLLYTTDIGHDMVGLTTARLREKEVHGPHIFVRHGTGLQLIADIPKPVDFAFLDSGPDGVRCEELKALWPYLAPSGVVAVHDTGIQHGLREHFAKTVNELGAQYFMFDTPRGLSLVRKSWAA